MNFDHPETRVEGTATAFESAANEWIEFNITDLIKGMIAENNSGTTKSVVLTLAPRSRADYPSLAHHGSVLFASKEYQDGIYAPRIEINAESVTEKSVSAIDDYYVDGDNITSKTDALYVSSAHSAIAEFSTDLDLLEDDELTEGKIVFSKLAGSPESKGLTAEILENVNDSTGTVINDNRRNRQHARIECDRISAKACGNGQKSCC